MEAWSGSASVLSIAPVSASLRDISACSTRDVLHLELGQEMWAGCFDEPTNRRRVVSCVTTDPFGSVPEALAENGQEVSRLKRTRRPPAIAKDKYDTHQPRDETIRQVFPKRLASN